MVWYSMVWYGMGVIWGWEGCGGDGLGMEWQCGVMGLGAWGGDWMGWDEWACGWGFLGMGTVWDGACIGWMTDVGWMTDMISNPAPVTCTYPTPRTHAR